MPKCNVCKNKYKVGFAESLMPAPVTKIHSSTGLMKYEGALGSMLVVNGFYKAYLCPQCETGLNAVSKYSTFNESTKTKMVK